MPLAAVNADQLRLLARVARLYHERGIRQLQIARDLHISQSRVSRLLSQAADLGIVRTTVTLPSGVYTDLEEQLSAQFGLLDCIVVDTSGSTSDLTPALGAAAAVYLGDTLMGDDRVGISSWSTTLLAAVEALRPRTKSSAELVVQMLGGVGDPQAQVAATRLLDRFATITEARPMFLPAPGLVSTPAARVALVNDPAVVAVQRIWEDLTLALVGIGAVQPSPLLQRSGNAVSPEHQAELHQLGVVGDVCFRFFDQTGTLVDSPFNDRVIGISPATLKAIPRRIGIAGGPNKHRAIRAAITGGWINTLITDLTTASALKDDPPT